MGVMVAMEEDHPVPPEEVQAVDVLQWEAQAQEVDVLRWEAQAQEVDVLRWEAQAVAQEVDVHPLEVLEADHQEVGLEIVQEAQALLMTASVVLPRGRQGSLVVRRWRSTSGPGRPAWSGAAARPCSAEPLLSATSGF